MTEKQIVWYILLTEVKIDSDTVCHPLSVAPLAVLPEFQRKGNWGGDVDSVSPSEAALLDYGTAVVLGHKSIISIWLSHKAID